MPKRRQRNRTLFGGLGQPKKRPCDKEVYQSKSRCHLPTDVADITENTYTFNHGVTNYSNNKTHGNSHTDVNHGDLSNNNNKKRISSYKHLCKLGTVNIRTGKEKSKGAKMDAITKDFARAGLSICLLQEVRYRNNGTQ